MTSQILGKGLIRAWEKQYIFVGKNNKASQILWCQLLYLKGPIFQENVPSTFDYVNGRLKHFVLLHSLQIKVLGTKLHFAPSKKVYIIYFILHHIFIWMDQSGK